MRRFPLSPFPGTSGSSGRSPAWRLGPFSLSPQRVLSLVLSVLLLATFLESWMVPLPAAHASSTLPSPPASMTFQQFLKEGRHDKVYHGPLIHAGNLPTGPKASHTTDYAHLPPSAEPPAMKPIMQPLSTAFLSGGTGTKPLDLVGSDGRLEVQLQPGALDLSHATVASGGQPAGALTLQLTQIHGHYAGQTNLLGLYQLQTIDSQGHVLNGIRLRTPLTFIYHYQPSELNALQLNADRLVMTWPSLIAAALQAKKPLTGLVIPMKNDPVAHTLTAQSMVVDVQPFTAGSGDPANQSPPTPHLASVQGNAGQVTYSYPLQVPPASGGFTPQLSLNYSSSGPNERHNPTSPANNMGDGWSLSLGSISAEVYPNTGQTWYFLSGIANAGDRLIPAATANFFDTEHISYLRIQQVNPGTATTCFHLWDKSGTYYELGCTADSLQYWTDSSGRHNYRWDVSKIIAPNEGASSGTYKLIMVSYLQDSVTSSGYTSIRDAAIKQITYGSGTTNAISTLAGTVDFHYKAPTATGTWADAYGTNYNCSSPPPVSTTLRCDDPVQMSGGFTAPTVMSTLSLQTVTSYIGSDGTASHTAYSYSFSYTDNPFQSCNDPVTLAPGYCAREHLLMSVTPTVYQNGTGHPLKAVNFGYTDPLQNTYYDGLHTVGNPAQPYTNQTWWQYLNFYRETTSGIGGQITYARAYNNTDGTPTVKSGTTVTDDRYDALYCTTHANDPDLTLRCTGNYAHPDDHAWSEQVVTQIQAWSQDSSSSSLQRATTTYGYYRLAKTSTYSGSGAACYPDQYQQEKDCVGNNWLPGGDTDWQDYYHAEYQGFAQVWTTSPANDLTVDYYYSTEGWYTPKSDYQNFQGGFLYQEEVYSGNSYAASALLQRTVNTYANYSNACRSTTATYPACEIVLLHTQTTDYELTNSSSAPYVQHDYTYDDYSLQYGLPGGGYHNLSTETVWGSSFPGFTRKWTYATNDQTAGVWTYYTVDKVTHSEVDDSIGHIWQCQDVTYDEGAPSGTPTPAAGWPTTVKTYSNSACTPTRGSPLTTTYQGYDQYGNAVAGVDGVATANSSLYTSNGCTLSTAPTIFTSAWGKTRYTTCTTYDTTYNAQPVTVLNALGQSTSLGYDPGQGNLPISSTDANSQSTTYTYSYDANGNRTVQATLPLHSGSYTTQSKTNSSCTTSSTLPCFEIDTNSYQYSGAITRTFYDGMGRAVETRTPGPGAGHDTIVFTVYNDQQHTSFQSVPFQVNSGSGWVDPNGATDYQGVAPGGTVTYDDALGRPLAVQDPLFGSSQEPGTACSATLTGSYTACTNYGLGTVSGDSNTYATISTVDPNKHVSVSFKDALGRTIYLQDDSGLFGGTLTINEQKNIQYNVLGEPTQVSVTDNAPQAGQSITSVTTSAGYDDLGKLTSLTDPDRGTHSYSYDADGHLLTNVSGTRTIGSNYDLLGRLGCIQNATPTTNATGACSAGSPYVQNTYDVTKLGTQGSTDFPVGRLTQSIATTYFPESTSATATEKMQYDQRGRLITAQLALGLPSSWNVTTALPSYQMAVAYNDANQVTTTTTSTNPAGQGYTTTQVYDGTTGALTGLSNNGTATANLATLLYNARAQLDTINFQTSTGSALAADQFGYDANLRPTSTSATWGNGSGSSGTILSQSRSYDNASNVISLSTTQAAVPGQSGSGGSETQNFCYDEQNRLVWAGNSGTQPGAGNGTCGSGTLSNNLSGASYSNSYIYTHLGQLWQGPLAGGSTQYQYLYCGSQPHQLTGLYPLGTTCSSKSGQVYTSSYDAWGNVTTRYFSGTTATLSYDLLDHFTEWNAGATNQEWYVYDASGQRVVRRTINSTSTTLRVYAFGLEEHKYSGSGTNQGNTYYYSLAGRLLGALDSSGTTFYLTDALGSVLASFSNVASSAAVKGNQVFGPYGTARYFKGSINTAKGFTGQYNDSLTGLDYYNARYYDPKVGVFLSADSKQGNMQGLNPYAYVGGNPETKNDPTGLAGCLPGELCMIGGKPGTLPEPTIPCSCGNPQPSPAPVALGGAGPYLPNDPGWHQVGNIIAWGYQFGKQIVTASVSEAFRRLEFNWLDDGIGVTLDRLIAFYLALTSQKYREDFKGYVKISNNVGAGFYYVTDAQGNLVTANAQDPVRGTNHPPYGENHSEQVLVNDLTQNVVPGINLQQGDTLHYVLYTQLAPCTYACQPKLTNSQWANQIRKAVGPGVNVDFSIWTSRVYGNPRKTPVINVTQVRPFYLYGYDADYNVSAEWQQP